MLNPLSDIYAFNLELSKQRKSVKTVRTLDSKIFKIRRTVRSSNRTEKFLLSEQFEQRTDRTVRTRKTLKITEQDEQSDNLLKFFHTCPIFLELNISEIWNWFYFFSAEFLVRARNQFASR